MKRIGIVSRLGLVLIVLLLILAGCGNSTQKEFSYSDGIDENGYWIGINALDYVTLFDYDNLGIPYEYHAVSEENIQYEIESLLYYYTVDQEVTNRAVVDGDTVNIDYVGSVDGVEFSGGTTDGSGTDVTIGVTNYIDDFLQQLIGKRPGATFNIEVTFPEDYGNEELNGKDAVFVTTINYIIESVEPQLNDEFVMSELHDDYGFSTVDDLRQYIIDYLQEESIMTYVEDYISYDVNVETPPESMISYQENAMIAYFEDYAEYYGVTFEEFLESNFGITTVDELKEMYYESNVQQANFYMVIQAIAEDAEITVSDDDILDYFDAYLGVSDYSDYVEEYGLPYVKQVVLIQKVLDRIVDNAVLLDANG